jgi:hypothetical protein
MCPESPMSSTFSTPITTLTDTNTLSQLTDTVKDSEEKKGRAQYRLIKGLKLTSFSSLGPRWTKVVPLSRRYRITRRRGAQSVDLFR